MSAGRSATLGDLEHEVAVMIRRVRRVVIDRARAVHPALAPSAYVMLTYVAENGPLRAASVVEQFDINKAAVSRQVTHLTDLGLLGRVSDPDDGRAMLLSVSAAGHDRLEEVARSHRDELDLRLGSWTDEELAAFVTALARYNQAMDSPGERAHAS